MSVYRVITRIIPLNSSESTFEPASFESLTDGNVGEIKVLNLTEPQSGMKYRIERIEYVQSVGPGETVDSINVAYAEKLKNIPGFVQLKANDPPLNPYDKSFQLTLPKVLSGRNSEEPLSQTNKSSSDSFKISVVKNYNFNKSNPSPKKKGRHKKRTDKGIKKHANSDSPNSVKKKRGRPPKSQVKDLTDTDEKMNTHSTAVKEHKSMCESKKRKSRLSGTDNMHENSDVQRDSKSAVEEHKSSDGHYESKRKKSRSSSTDDIQENSGVQSDSKSSKAFKTKYPSYLSKKIRKSVWRGKHKSSPTKQGKTSKRSKMKDDVSGSVVSNSEDFGCPTSSYVEANKDIDSGRNIKFKLPNGDRVDPSISKLDSALDKDLCDMDREDEEKTDTSLDLFDDLDYGDYGDLIINDEGADNIFGNDSFHSLNQLNTPEPPNSPAEGNSNEGSAPEDESFKDVSAQNNDCSLTSVQSENDQDESNACCKYRVVEGHKLYDLLMSLKKYFVNGECLICGFIPAEPDYNASEHMETHISSNSFVSCFKCFCCDEKFPNPRNLYQHALSRDKSYKYMCTICTLKFKRKHYLTRHTAKSH